MSDFTKFTIGPDRNGNVFSDELRAKINQLMLPTDSLITKARSLRKPAEPMFFDPYRWYDPPATSHTITSKRAVHALEPDAAENTPAWFNDVAAWIMAKVGADQDISYLLDKVELEKPRYEAAANALVRDYAISVDYRPYSIGGLKVNIVDSWVSGYAWRYYTQRAVPPHGKRKGTRKQWKRANPRGWRWRYGPVEPDVVIKTDNEIYCTHRQWEFIKRGTLPTGDDPKRGPAVSLGFELDRVPYMDRNNTYYEGGSIVVPHCQDKD